jgi:hypothetical protein
MTLGFPAGKAEGHHLVNASDIPVAYFEVGDRSAGDNVSDLDDDLMLKDADGRRATFLKSGKPYWDFGWISRDHRRPEVGAEKLLANSEIDAVNRTPTIGPRKLVG